MYSRRLGDQTYSWEPSGGLLNSSLVMMDRETDSHWSILTEEAIWGPAKGQRLEVIPGAVRSTYGEWVAEHPDTLVLSVGGQEHIEKDPYVDYFTTERTFGELVARDRRFGNKELIYAFHWEDGPYAVPHKSFYGGNVVEIGGRQLFLYRQADDPNYRSTMAVLAAPGSEFVRKNGGWEVAPQGLKLDTEKLEFAGGDGSAVSPFPGFDTFWYTWNLSVEDAQILEPASG